MKLKEYIELVIGILLCMLVLAAFAPIAFKISSTIINF